MSRRRVPAIAWVARVAAAAVVVAIAGVGVGIRGDDGHYARAAHEQRSDVTREAAVGAPAPLAGERWLCVRGAAGFASAAAAEYVAGLRDADGIIVPASLAAVSGAAVEAARWAEQGGGAALPQRVGLDNSGATLAPPQARCDGSLAFAQARVSARGLPAEVVPAPAPPPTKGKPSTKKAGAKQATKKAATKKAATKKATTAPARPGRTR